MTTMMLERPFPTGFEQSFDPLLPGEGLGAVADEHLEQLALHGFIAARGLYLEQAVNIANIVQDPKVVEYCPDDYENRFGTIGKQRTWVAKNGGRAMLGIYAIDGHVGSIDVADIPSVGVHEVSMVATAWGGAKPNEYIPSAEVTTAYRAGSVGSWLARESRVGEDDKFSLGLPLGHLTIANLVHHHGVPTRKISLKNWESNEPAMRLYDLLDFHEVDGVPRIAAIRPTLREAGENVNGNVVRYQRSESGAELGTREVDDRRVFQALHSLAA